MHNIKRLIRRYLPIRTMCLVWTVRLTLWLLPFHIVCGHIHRLNEKHGKRKSTENRHLSVIAHRVTRVSRYVPKATCLTQAIATMILLYLKNYPATLRIGVARNNEGRFEAHAWVESEGSVVIGGSKTNLYSKYSLLPLY